MPNNEYSLVAPDIDRLLRFFCRGHLNARGISESLKRAIEPIFDALILLAPLKKNDNAKCLWLFIPRGDISDYDSFEDLKDYAGIETYEEYEHLWKTDYPLEKMWYELVIVEEKNRDGKIDYRAVTLGEKTIVSARMDEKPESRFSDEAAEKICELILPAVKESLEMIHSGTYNNLVNKSLPYKFRTGVIKRSVLWENDSEQKKFDFDGLSENTISKYRRLLQSGMNDKSKISRIKDFTANDFFKACELDYKALNYETKDLNPSELYLKYADGRDEGLTGRGYGLNEGPDINFNDYKSWNEWYFGNRNGGHPWEIIRGGNSTHVDLFVCHDKINLDFQYRLGKISNKEYKIQLKNAGFYFRISGKHRPLESVTFYTVLSDTGLPVILENADEILARFDGNDYVGIVPHSCPTRYCENLFPEKYGKIIDFMHVFDEEIEKYGHEIIWIPEEEALLIPS